MTQTHKQPNWIERNWKWFFAVLIPLCLACVVGFAILLFHWVTSTLRSSEPYVHAMELTRKHPDVVQSMGIPIEESWWMTCNLTTSGRSGTASYAIPISGPKGKATVFVEATREGDNWQYELLIVQLGVNSQRIDLAFDGVE